MYKIYSLLFLILLCCCNYFKDNTTTIQINSTTSTTVLKIIDFNIIVDNNLSFCEGEVENGYRIIDDKIQFGLPKSIYDECKIQHNLNVSIQHHGEYWGAWNWYLDRSSDNDPLKQIKGNGNGGYYYILGNNVIAMDPIDLSIFLSENNGVIWDSWSNSSNYEWGIKVCDSNGNQFEGEKELPTWIEKDYNDVLQWKITSPPSVQPATLALIPKHYLNFTTETKDIEWCIFLDLDISSDNNQLQNYKFLQNNSLTDSLYVVFDVTIDNNKYFGFKIMDSNKERQLKWVKIDDKVIDGNKTDVELTIYNYGSYDKLNNLSYSFRVKQIQNPTRYEIILKYDKSKKWNDNKSMKIDILKL